MTMIRNIQLSIDGDPDQCESAQAQLLKLSGCDAVSVSKGNLDIRYELPLTTAATIVDFIDASGPGIVLNWRQRASLWLRYYQEAIFIENMNDETGWDSCVREIYVSRYRHRRHGRRDDRPRHWRKYDTRPEPD